MQSPVHALALLLVGLVFLPGSAAARDAEAAGCPVPEGYHAAAFQEPMAFFAGWNRGNSPMSQWIVGVGVIDGTTPAKLAEFLSTVEYRRQRLILHSPGGDLLAGLRLGLQIREAGISTQVGRTFKLDMEDDHPCRTLEGHVESGECSSACAYAFLGGVARELSSEFFVTPQSRLGFHQFYGGHDIQALAQLAPDEAAAQTTITTQIVVGYIASYLAELDMDPGILGLASGATPNEMHYPEPQTLADLGAITPPVFNSWFLEPYNDGMVAASREFSPLTPAQQLTAYCRSSFGGEPVIMLTSDFSPVNVRAFLEPFARPIGAEASQHSGTLEIDGMRHAIPAGAIEIASTGDLVFVRMRLTGLQAQALRTAQRITLTYDAPRYQGFQSGRAVLSERDRKSIALAFRNCV